jgi:hypothetical protein
MAKTAISESGLSRAVRSVYPTVFCVLHVHPSRKGELVRPENFRIEPAPPVENYFDGFGNHPGRVNAPAGVIRFLNDEVIRDPDELGAYAPEPPQLDVLRAERAADRGNGFFFKPFNPLSARNQLAISLLCRPAISDWFITLIIRRHLDFSSFHHNCVLLRLHL